MIRAQIAALEVQGFRCFQKQRTFKFRGPNEQPPETLVVAGPNGSGKSSFFEAILYGLGREDLLHRQLRKEHHRRWIRTAIAPDFRIRLSLYVAEASGTILATRAPCSVFVDRSPSGWSVQVGEESISDEQSALRTLLAQFPVEWFSSWRQPYLAGPVRPMSGHSDSTQEEASRLWRVKQRIVDERARSAFHNEPSRDEEWLERLTCAWLALRGEDETRFAIKGDESDTAFTHFDLWVERSSQEFGAIPVCPVDQLSSGELEWLALAGTLITTNFEGIVLIDEPGLHFHPEWQARLLPALRDVVPRSQLIIASHADPPWDQVYSFERVLLGAPGDPRLDAEDTA